MNYQRLSDHSMLHPPPGGWLMAVLQAYLDDSGSIDDPNCSAFGIAGYVASVDSWNAFEPAWKAILDKHGVPYLHMKEFGSPSSPLGRLSMDQRANLISDAATLIGKSDLYGIGAVVRIRDVAKFNTEKNRAIDPRALALYGCMQEIYSKYQGEAVEIRLDNLQKPFKVLEAAYEYARRFMYDDISQNLEIMPIQNGESFKTVLPMQAADFAAYEIRKFNEDDAEWFEKIKPNVAADSWHGSHFEWKVAQGKQWPGYRKSFAKLVDASPIDGAIWDYVLLCGLDFYNLKDGVWSVPGWKPEAK